MRNARKSKVKILLYFSDRLIQEVIYQALDRDLNSQVFIIKSDGTEAGLWASLRKAYETLLPEQHAALIGMGLEREAERLLVEFPGLRVFNLAADDCTLDVISLELTHRRYRAGLHELCRLLIE